jgi:hypothetical protein
MTMLTKMAETNNVSLPPRFFFGFTRYAEGALPEPQHLPRLTIQFQMIRKVCEIFFAESIQTLEIVQREEFEEEKKMPGEELIDPRMLQRMGRRPPKKSGTQRARPEPTEEQLYSSERIVFEFTGDSRALWQVLNKLAQSSLFTVVREVDLVNEARPEAALEKVTKGRGGTRGRPPAGMGDLLLEPGMEDAFALPGAPPPGAEPDKAMAEELMRLSHDERVVAGREMLRVNLDLELYRFKKDGPEEEQTDAGE